MLPFVGRRIWFVGVGGAGLSAYAILARAWGAEVGGWDRKETPYLDGVRAAGIPVELAPDPVVPAGFELVVSSAYPAVPGRSRAEFLAELVGLAPSIVVAGAHGKTTTAAMIAFCLAELGRDPSYLIGGEVPQLGGNARAGSGWLVVEGDESDRTVTALRPQIAVLTNVDLDHHCEFGSLAELEQLFDDWLATVPQVVHGEELPPADLPLVVPGEHNRRNAASALAALELAGVPRAEAEPVLGRFRGVGRRFELRGEAAGVCVVDDYAHLPAEITATVAAARALARSGRVIALFQPHLYTRTRHLSYELACALSEADELIVLEIYAARESPIPGVSGKLLVELVGELSPGKSVVWAPTVEDAAAAAAALAGPDDLVLTLGAGDVDLSVPLILERLARRER